MTPDDFAAAVTYARDMPDWETRAQRLLHTYVMTRTLDSSEAVQLLDVILAKLHTLKLKGTQP